MIQYHGTGAGVMQAISKHAAAALPAGILVQSHGCIN